jgi:hypothetical protein
MSSETPRTDAEEQFIDAQSDPEILETWHDRAVRLADLSRQLERELSAAWATMRHQGVALDKAALEVIEGQKIRIAALERDLAAARQDAQALRELVRQRVEGWTTHYGVEQWLVEARAALAADDAQRRKEGRE